MFAVKEYDWDFGGLDDIIYFNKRENAEKEARQYMEIFISKERKDESPADYDCETWEEYINNAIQAEEEEGVFSLEEIHPAD